MLLTGLFKKKNKLKSKAMRT